MSEPIDVPRGSYCTRCLTAIPADAVAAFLKAQHLCPTCEGTSDSVHAQRIVATERQATVPT